MKENLPNVGKKMSKNMKYKKCPICAASFAEDKNQKTTILACTHKFHIKCITKARKITPCPLCNTHRNKGMTPNEKELTKRV